MGSTLCLANKFHTHISNACLWEKTKDMCLGLKRVSKVKWQEKEE